MLSCSQTGLDGRSRAGGLPLVFFSTEQLHLRLICPVSVSVHPYFTSKQILLNLSHTLMGSCYTCFIRTYSKITTGSHPKISIWSTQSTESPNQSRTWWHTPVNPSCVKQRQEDHSKYEASLIYVMSSKSDRAIW